MSIQTQSAGSTLLSWRVWLFNSVVARSQSRTSRQRIRSASRNTSFVMLTLSGWWLGKLSRLLTSCTGQPSVSASSTSAWKPFGSRPTNSARMTGRFAAAIMSAARSSAAGSAVNCAGTCIADFGGSGTSWSSGCSCSHAS